MCVYARTHLLFSHSGFLIFLLTFLSLHFFFLSVWVCLKIDQYCFPCLNVSFFRSFPCFSSRAASHDRCLPNFNFHFFIHIYGASLKNTSVHMSMRSVAVCECAIIVLYSFVCFILAKLILLISVRWVKEAHMHANNQKPVIKTWSRKQRGRRRRRRNLIYKLKTLISNSTDSISILHFIWHIVPRFSLALTRRSLPFVHCVDCMCAQHSRLIKLIWNRESTEKKQHKNKRDVKK